MPEAFLKQIGRGRSFRFKCERAIRINRDHDRDLHIRVVVLRFGVERLAKLHDVDAVLTECRPDRRCRIRFAGRNL